MASDPARYIQGVSNFLDVPATPSKRARKPRSFSAPSPAAANAAAASFAALTSRLDYLVAADVEKVRQAYRFADEAHLGQIRSSGEPYITHPIAVAAQCAEWNLDAQALMAALLHDALEDCGVTKSELIDRFGAPVAELVDGLTKLDKLHFNTREENQAESFRKMLLAMARDVRVILIKLADRSHNMRTLGNVPRDKWGRISSETLEIYAPIAHRLGLNQVYRELQDLSFAHLHPWRDTVLAKAVEKARSRRRDLIQKVHSEVEAAFSTIEMPLRIAGREKSVFSIYRKMKLKHLTFAKVTDIYGFRLIVPTLIDCYTALGVLHQLYKPVPGRFKDHIAIGKVNGYQSLHTTLVGPSGVNVEFQVRTEAMNLIAESGVAAHWLYKAKSPEGTVNDNLGNQWLQSLLDIQRETGDAAEFWDHVKVDLFPDAVYVFTPRSQILSLPRGATVVDFAYAIHSDVGDRTVAGAHQWRTGSAAQRTQEWRCGRSGHRVHLPAQSGLAEFRAHRQSPLQDPSPSQDARPVPSPRFSARSCWRRHCVQRALRTFPRTKRSTRQSGIVCCVLPATAVARSCSTTWALANGLPPSWPNGWWRCWPRSMAKSPMPCCSRASASRRIRQTSRAW